MADPIRERLAADEASGVLQPLEAYQRLFPGREAEVARAFAERAGGSSSGTPLEHATRRVVDLEALRDPAAERLRVGEPIGSGGMGEVLAVRDEVLRRDLAMKRVRARDLAAPEAEDGEPAPDGVPILVRRLLEEAQITAQLDHPGVVPVHELGLDAAGRAYFTMKRVHGRTLDEVFRRARAGQEGPLARTLQVFVRICETLAYAYRKGVVHRDVKPANVMVGRYGEVYLMDWGLAKVREDAPTARPDLPEAGASGVVSTLRSELLRLGEDASLTLHGQVVGTLGYLSPEQLTGGTVDERTDVYAVGAMLYELLAGHAPYREPGADADPRRVLVRLLGEPPTPLAACAPQAPPELVAIAEKALARDPARRFPTAQALAEDLQAYLEGRVVRSHRTGTWIELSKWARRNRWLAAGLAALVLAVLGTVVAFVAQQRSAAVAVGRERDRAQEEARRAQAEGRRADGLRLAAQSRLLPEDPGLALALAVEAGRRAPGAASFGAIYAALRAHREWRCFHGHEQYVSHGRWTPDGRRLVSADESGLVVVWDVEADAPHAWLEGPAAAVVALAVSPDGRLAAVAHDDGVVRVWDLAAGTETTTLPAAATSLAFVAAERLLLATREGSVDSWDVSTGARTSLHRGQGPARLADGIEPGAARVAVVAPARLTLLDLERSTSVGVTSTVAGNESRAVQSTSAGQVLVRWNERLAVAYDLASGEEVRKHGGRDAVESAGWSGDGRRLALGLRADGEKRRVLVLEAASGDAVASVEADAGVEVHLSRDGRSLAAVGRGHATWVELTDATRVVPLRGHRYTVVGAALSPDERFLATLSHDLTTRVWALAPENERAALARRAAAGHGIRAWSQDATRALVVPPSRDAPKDALEVVDTGTGSVVARFPVDVAALRTAGLDATGGRAWWLEGRTWRVVDVATGEPVHAVRLAEEVPGHATVLPSPDGRRLAIPRGDHLAVFDQATGALVGRVAQGRQPMRPMWAWDSDHLVVAHPPLALSALYRFDGAEPLRTFLGHSGFVTDAEADPLGRWVVSVAADTTVRRFDAATGRMVGVYRGLPLRGASLTVGPRGERIAVSSSKHVLLDAGPDGELREHATLDREENEQLVLHPDGRRFWLLDEGQRARLWDLDAVAEGRRALRRPVLRADGVQDYAPDPADPLDAPWIARDDPWWSLERARRLLAEGRLDEAERALDQAGARRPRWATPDLERARLVAARATARGASVADTVPELVRLLESAQAKGLTRLASGQRHEPPPELQRYLGDARVRERLTALGMEAR